MIQPLAPGSADRTHRIARHGRRPYITDMFESEFPAHTAAIKRKIASIECDDALILPHRANPAGSDFREPQPARPSSRARSAGGGRRRRSPDHVIENDAVAALATIGGVETAAGGVRISVPKWRRGSLLVNGKSFIEIR